MKQACPIARPSRLAAIDVKVVRLRTVISLLLMLAVPSSALAGFGMANCQRTSRPAAGAVHHDGAAVDHAHGNPLVVARDAMAVTQHGDHHHRRDQGQGQQHCSCSDLCVLACAVVYALPIDAQPPLHLALSDHPARATQRELADAPPDKPFRPPIFFCV